MKSLFSIATLLIAFNFSFGQNFIDKAVIEYEVKTNLKKTFGNGRWAELMQENSAPFKTGYFKLTFANNKSIYKFDRWDESAKVPDFLRKEDEPNIWYFDYNQNTYSTKKQVVGADIILNDSIQNIKWRLTNESRVIAGFNCRKAVGVIMDSIYVFAFYSEELLLPGGPCSIHGLPGTILGVTIPRLYVSFIATKVNVTGVDEKVIEPVTDKKPYTNASFNKLITDRAKEWREGWGGNEEETIWINQFVWKALL